MVSGKDGACRVAEVWRASWEAVRKRLRRVGEDRTGRVVKLGVIKEGANKGENDELLPDNHW